MHCQGITQYWVHNLLGRSVFLDKKESKKQCTLLRGTIRWRRTTSNLLLITKFEMFLHNVGQIFFNIRGWAIFGEICLKIGIFGVPIWEWYFIRARHVIEILRYIFIQVCSQFHWCRASRLAHWTVMTSFVFVCYCFYLFSVWHKSDKNQ